MNEVEDYVLQAGDYYEYAVWTWIQSGMQKPENGSRSKRSCRIHTKQNSKSAESKIWAKTDKNGSGEILNTLKIL